MRIIVYLFEGCIATMFPQSFINKSLRLHTSVTANRRLQPSAQQYAEPPAMPDKVPVSLCFNEIKLQLMCDSAGLLTIAISKEMGRPPVSGEISRGSGMAERGRGTGGCRPEGSLAPGTPLPVLPSPC